MSVVTPTTEENNSEILLKDYYIDENGHEQERTRIVKLPKFGSTELIENSFNILEDDE